MIIFKKEPFNCQMKNMIVLDDNIAGGCVYVNKETYDQAIAISLIYSQDQQRVENIVAGPNQEWKNNQKLVSAIKEAREELPEPLNMLAIFLIYADSSSINWGIDNEEEFAKQVYGVLHMLSQFVDFYAITTVPAEIRSKLNIPKNILMSYNDSWDVLTSTLGDFKMAVPAKEVAVQQPIPTVVQTVAPAVATPAPTVTAAVEQPTTTPIPAPVQTQAPTPAPAQTQEEEDEDEDDREARELYEKMQAMFKEIDETPASELAKKQGTTTGSYGASNENSSKEDNREILTDDLKKEKGIAEESQKILNSYDI